MTTFGDCLYMISVLFPKHVQFRILLKFYRAVGILKDCASSNVINLLVARDAGTQMEFKRLSTSLQATPQGHLMLKFNCIATS